MEKSFMFRLCVFLLRNFVAIPLLWPHKQDKQGQTVHKQRRCTVKETQKQRKQTVNF